MARVTPEQAADKWQSRLSAATTEITQGVNAVTVAPGQKAAAASDAWANNTLAAKEKFKRNVARVSLGDWQAKMRDVGIPRIASGAAANKPKMAQFMGEFLPHLDRGVSAVRSMPSATLEDGIARATAMIRHNAKFVRGGGAS